MNAQQEYDAFYEAEFRALFQRLLNSSTSAQNKAGISMLMAAFAVAFHSARASELDKKLGRAPMQSQIDETLNLLREVLVVSDRPKPQLVQNTKEQG